MSFLQSFSRRLWMVGFFFFFQAEDGIRDKLVTGVQTCALPICKFICEKIFSQMNLQSVSDAGNNAEAPPELLLFAMPGPRGLAQKRARNGRVFGAMSNDQIGAIRICRCVLTSSLIRAQHLNLGRPLDAFRQDYLRFGRPGRTKLSGLVATGSLS